MTYTGQCLCGAVKLRIEGKPVAVRQCWCRQCQAIAAGGPTHNAIFKAADITLTGELAVHGYTAESGNQLTHHFCAHCGCHVMGKTSARMHLSVVRLGVIDQPHDLKPGAAIWLDEAPAWAAIDPALEHWPRQSPPPAPAG